MEENRARLIESIKTGRASFDELIRLYQESVWRTVYQIAGNYHDTEDVVQETFVKVYTKLDTYDADRPFKPWIRRIAVNEAISMLRRKGVSKKATSKYAERKTEHGTPEEGGPIRNLLVEKIRQVLGGLDPVYRTAFALYYMEDLSVQEISLAMEKKPGTVKSYLFRARGLIRTQIGEEGIE